MTTATAETTSTTVSVPEEQTELVPLHEIGLYLLDTNKITPEWLRDFWGFEERTIGSGFKNVAPYRELMYPGKGHTHPSFSRPYYDLKTGRLMVEGYSYRRKKSGHFYSYQGLKIDKGRFFGWMWSRGYLPKGWGV